MKRRLVVVGGAAPLLGAALIPMGQDLALAQGLTLAQSRAACPVAGVAAVPEPVPLVPSASGSRSAAASPKLAVSVQGRQHDALVDYRIVARNTGTAPAKNVVVTVRLLCAPPGIAPVSRPVAAAGGISAGPDSMIWRLDLAGGTGSTAGARYSVPAPGGTLTTRVTATGAASNCPGSGSPAAACLADLVVKVKPPVKPHKPDMSPRPQEPHTLPATELRPVLPVPVLPRPAPARPALHRPALHRPALHRPALHRPALHRPALPLSLHRTALDLPASALPAQDLPASVLPASALPLIAPNPELVLVDRPPVLVPAEAAEDGADSAELNAALHTAYSPSAAESHTALYAGLAGLAGLFMLGLSVFKLTRFKTDRFKTDGFKRGPKGGTTS